jgi:hypothetical protein
MAGIKRTTLFNASDIQQAGKYHEITLFNATTDEAVSGIFSGSLSFNWAAKFSELENAMPNTGSVAKFLQDTGFVPTGNFHTNKLYENGDYLNYSINLRINDTYGDGAPMKAAMILARWTAPFDWWGTKFDTTGQYTEDAIYKNDGSKSVSKSNGVVKNNFTNKDFSAISLPKKLTSIVNAETIANKLTETLGLITDMKIDVIIGDWFSAKGNMIIESVSQTFSKEQGPSGPLYCDFNINVSSMNIMTKKQISELFPLIEANQETNSKEKISISNSRYT